MFPALLGFLDELGEDNGMEMMPHPNQSSTKLSTIFRASERGWNTWN